MKARNATEADPESEQEVSKHSRTTVASKLTPAYWADRVARPVYLRNGVAAEVPEYHAQIQHAGVRRRVPMRSNDRQEAGRNAAKFYRMLQTLGWNRALAQWDPQHGISPKERLSIGDYLIQVRAVTDVRDRSFANYAYALRKIAREVVGLRDSSRTRFNPKDGVWRKIADGIDLAKLTPEGVERWKRSMVESAGRSPVAQIRARRNINSFVRNARALFSRSILKKLAEQKISLPDPLPFEGIELLEQGSTHYVSTIDPGSLLRQARYELAGKDPDAWLVILLALGAGLRRSEIDTLTWPCVDAGKSEIRILRSDHFQAKTDDSEGAIHVDKELMAELASRRELCQGSLFVIEPETEMRHTKAVQSYRCSETFERATAWLRSFGVMADKPLHTLRKEFGSIVCAASDIHTASRQLRHSNLSTTAAYYLDGRRRTCVPVGELLRADFARPAKGAE